MRHSPNPTDVTAALRYAARGDLAAEAAVELLVQHDVWLHRGDFAEAALDNQPGGHVRIEWVNATSALDTGRLPCSPSEEGILRIAASIAAGVPVALGTFLESFDSRNRELVVAAVRHASGKRAWPA